jgi:general secretion pathway protein G
MSKRHRAGAFTLIELLLVMVILVVLASIVTVGWTKQRARADFTKAKTDIANYSTALDAFQITCGRFPTDEEGLNALTTNPGLPGWTGPYVKIIELDPWGDNYVYQAPGTHFPDSYDLHSAGPDKHDGDEDDIGNWQGGSAM